jgi:hypothetical protein
MQFFPVDFLAVSFPILFNRVRSIGVWFYCRGARNILFSFFFFFAVQTIGLDPKRTLVSFYVRLSHGQKKYDENFVFLLLGIDYIILRGKTKWHDRES